MQQLLVSRNIPKYICPVCGMPMAFVFRVVVKHIDNKCYEGELWACADSCNRFIKLVKATECGEREFKFKGNSEFSVLYDIEELSWI